MQYTLGCAVAKVHRARKGGHARADGITARATRKRRCLFQCGPKCSTPDGITARAPAAGGRDQDLAVVLNA